MPLVPDEQGPNRAATPPSEIWLSTNGPSLIDLPALSSPVVRHGRLPLEECRSLFRSIFSKAVVRTTGCQAAECRLSGVVFDLREDRNGSIPPVQVTQKQSVKLRTTCRGGPRSQYPEQRQLESARGAPPNCRFMGVTSRRLQGETSLEYLCPSSVRDQRKAGRRIGSVGGARTA